jgi:hypothetical protein
VNSTVDDICAYICCRVHVMAFSVVPSRSGVVRTFQQRTLLEVPV